MIDLTNNRAVATLIVVLAMLILAVLGFTLASLIGRHLEIAKEEVFTQQAFYVADSGIQRALGILKVDPNWRTTGVTESIGRGKYTIVVQDDLVTGEVVITSTGVVSSGKKTLQARKATTVTWKELLAP